MAVTDTRKDPGPHPTTELPINPPAYADDSNNSRTASEKFIDQQWRDAKARDLGKNHPGSINQDTSYA